MKLGDTREEMQKNYSERIKKAHKVGRTLVPIRAIAETLWMNVEWDGSTRTVYIYE